LNEREEGVYISSVRRKSAGFIVPGTAKKKKAANLKLEKKPVPDPEKKPGGKLKKPL